MMIGNLYMEGSMRPLIFVLLVFFSGYTELFAQQKTITDIQNKVEKKIKKFNSLQLEPGWNSSLSTTLTVTQSSQKHWAPGGSNIFVWIVGLDGSAIYDTNAFNWSTDAQLIQGASKQNGQEMRKNDDVFILESVLTVKEKKLLNPYMSLNFQTQFWPGYKYEGPAKSKISDFLDPGYLVNGLGVGYSPTKTFRTRFGLAARSVITHKYSTLNDGERIDTNAGMQWVTYVEQKFWDKVHIKSNLQLFSSFKSIKEGNIQWDTKVEASITKYIIVKLQTFFIVDANISPYTQFKEVLSVGLKYTFI